MTHPVPVTVVIPTYAGGPFLGDAIRSLRAQARPPAEVLVVDDCSPDDTAAIATRLANTCPFPVRVLTTGANSGSPARPINIGIREARSELVAVLDQDDVFLPRRLASGASLLERNPSQSMSVCACRVFVYGRWLQVPTRSVWNLRRLARTGDRVRGGHQVGGRSFLARLVSAGNFVVGYPGFMFRRQAALAAGGADESLRVASDYDLLCKLARLGDVGVAPEVLYLRREHVQNLSRTSAMRCAVEMIQIMRHYGRQLHGHEPDERFWLAVENQYLWAVNQLAWGDSHREAIRRVLGTFRNWGVRPEAVFTGCKLAFSYLMRRLAARRPSTNESLEKLLRQELDYLLAVRQRVSFA